MVRRAKRHEQLSQFGELGQVCMSNDLTELLNQLTPEQRAWLVKSYAPEPKRSVMPKIVREYDWFLIWDHSYCCTGGITKAKEWAKAHRTAATNLIPRNMTEKRVFIPVGGSDDV